MGDYKNLKQAISDVIKQNGNQEITGLVLQSVLRTIVTTIGANAAFAGVATPETNPGTPDQKVFYIASTAGDYSNFGHSVADGEVVIFYNSSDAWAAIKTDILSKTILVSQLGNTKSAITQDIVTAIFKNLGILELVKNTSIVTNQGVGNVCPLTETSSDVIDSLKIDAKKGEVYHITGVGGDAGRCYALVSKVDNTIIAVADSMYRADLYLEIPQNCWLVINLYNEKGRPAYGNNIPYAVQKVYMHKESKPQVEECEQNLKVSENIFINAGYLDINTGQISTSQNWKYTDPITLEAGESIIVYARGYTNARPIIAKVENGVYETVVMQEGNDRLLRRYYYKADTDCSIICFRWGLVGSTDIDDGYIIVSPSIYRRIFKQESYDISNAFRFADNAAIIANPNIILVNGLDSKFGLAENSSLFACSQYVDISTYAGCYLRISVPIKGKTASANKTSFGLCFYDKEKTAIDTSYHEILERRDKATDIIIIKIPEEARYVRTTWLLSTDTDFSSFKCTAIKYNECIYEKLNGDELCNYYACALDGEIVDSDDYSVSSLYMCKGCIRMDLTVNRSSTEINIAAVSFYDSEENFIGSYPVYDGWNQSNAVQVVPISIPLSAAYCRFSYKKYGTRNADFECTLYSDKQCIKRKYISGMINFSQTVNQNPHKYWDIDSQEVPSKNSNVTTGVLMLPENYTAYGKPTPVILYCHGASHYVYFGKWGATQNFMTQKEHWLAKGFAVMDCNGPRDSNKANITGLGSYSSVQGYYKSWQYVKQHYNVEDKCYLIGGSAGSLNALNFMFFHSNEINAFIILSGVTNITIQTPYNTTLEEQFGLTSYDEEKMTGINPQSRILDIGGQNIIPFLPVPIYAILGSLEQSSYASIWNNLTAFIDALRNGKQAASITILEGLDHRDIVSGANEVVDAMVIDYFTKI